MLLGNTLPIAAQGDFEFPPDPGDPTTLLSYNVSVGINDSNMGYVSGAGKFKYGRTITISTSAQSGYRFVKLAEGWRGLFHIYLILLYGER